MGVRRLGTGALIWLAACAPATSTPSPTPAVDATEARTSTTTIQSPGASTTSLPSTTSTTVRECPIVPPIDLRLETDDPAVAASTLSTAIRPECADVVVVSSSDATAMRTASGVAAIQAAPMLIAGDDQTSLRSELNRLRPRRVITVGTRIERVPESAMSSRQPRAEDVIPSTNGTALMLVDRANEALIPVVTAYASQIGAEVREVPRDLRRADPGTRAAIQSAPSISLIGGFGPAAEWQLEVVRRGLELPGGGQVLFPGRRLVALYGTPYAPGLGVLGEQPADESVVLATELAGRYQAVDGTPTLAAFDLITTVASADAGADGDYSHELSVAELRPWVEAAGRGGVYVLLDLQPGRTDFMTQAQRYEELLSLPHVGLALDPEWRLGPDEFHLRQIGSVTGAEVNTVSEWLAGLVRQHHLPQKLFVVHQFKLSMISDRQDLRTPSELAVVIQMDGQGPLGTKYDTYAAITAGTDGVRWRWGWKNFYDEDSPTATPEQTLAVEPVPVFVSYQ